MKVEVKIRQACSSDLDEIVGIFLQGQAEDDFRISRDSVTEFYASFLADQRPQFGFWLATLSNETGERILGWQALLPCRPQPLFAETWAQSSTYISEDVRAKGVGRLLLEYVTSNARGYGLTHITGFVRVDNPAPIHLVESLGWIRVGEIPSFAGEPARYQYVYLARPELPTTFQ